MKKVIIFLSVLALLLMGAVEYHHSQARMSLMIAAPQEPAAAGGGDCPAGTYKFYWNGDHSSGDDHACVDSGNSSDAWDATNGGAVGSAYGYAGDGFGVTGDNQYRIWTVTSDDIFSEDLGTICVRFWVDASVDDECVLFESEYNNDGENYLLCHVEAADTVLCKQEGNNSAIYARSDGDTVNLNAWNYMCYRYDPGSTTHGVSLNGATWDDDAEAVAWVVEPNDFGLGEYETGVNFTENCYVDEIFVFGTYETDTNPYD